MQVFQTQNLKWTVFWQKKRGNISGPFIFALRRRFMYFFVIGHLFLLKGSVKQLFLFSILIWRGKSKNSLFCRRIDQVYLIFPFLLSLDFLLPDVLPWFLYSTIKKREQFSWVPLTFFRCRYIQEDLGLSGITEHNFVTLSLLV